jgi:GntR family transcriptional regulator
MNLARDSNEIDRDTPIPLYFQIARILRDEIGDGTYPPGECIPTEAELQKRFAVSRSTIRQAVGDLVHQGLLERRRSKGTVVSSTHLETKLSDLASFTNEMLNHGFNLTTKILSLGDGPFPASVADSLKLEPSELVTSLERLRFVDDKPMALEKWYACEKHVPGLDKSMFAESGVGQSTYYILMKQYGIEVTHAIDTVSPMAVQGRQAKLLQVRDGTPVLLRTRTSMMANDQPVTYASGVYLIRVRFFLQARRRAHPHS